MAACPWSHTLDVEVVGEGFYVGPHRIPMKDVPDFLDWLKQVATGEVTW